MPGPTVHVVLVEPQVPGNVGAVARAAWNFGVDDLHVVGSLPRDEEAVERARDAVALLEEARVHDDLGGVADEVDLLAGFTARTSRNPKRHTREAVDLGSFAEDLGETAGEVGLVFGPEDRGLETEAIRACDVAVTIPTSDDYPSMNLSHAAAVALYATTQTPYEHPADEVRPLDGHSRELLLGAFDDLLRALGVEERRRVHTMTAWRRVMGRALPSKWEYHRLMGAVTDAAERLEAGAGEPAEEEEEREEGAGSSPTEGDPDP